jgi:hypothetical protein
MYSLEVVPIETRKMWRGNIAVLIGLAEMMHDFEPWLCYLWSAVEYVFHRVAVFVQGVASPTFSLVLYGSRWMNRSLGVLNCETMGWTTLLPYHSCADDDLLSMRPVAFHEKTSLAACFLLPD